jgi:hydrogenase-4 component F
MALALIVAPLAFALLAFLVPSERIRIWCVPGGAATHLGLVLWVLHRGEAGDPGAWLLLDPLGKLMLGFASVLFFICSIYVPGYLALRRDRPNRVFVSCLLLFHAMLTLITLSQHLGLMWVAIEATTLASAPLLYFNKTPRSLEATWKYLLVGSVGIALALLGTFFLAYAGLRAGHHPSLLLANLVRDARQLSPPWLHAAFIVLFVGYGTKMGLAPMHTWKPDAYGEAPGVVGALLAGGLTSAAFMAILRFYRICVAAEDGAFARSLMVTMGLLSMAVAGVFMARQRDFKRMLAYSSVEHMGILVLGIGLGGAGVFGSLLHMVNNGFAKGVLFLSAANIHRAFGSKVTNDVSGALQRVPVSGAMFLAGFFAITGSPPFGPFISEFTILNAAFSNGRYVVGGLFLLFLAVVFVGMGTTVLSVVFGKPRTVEGTGELANGFLTIAPMAACLSIVLLLGLYVPAPLDRLLREVAASFDSTQVVP